MQEFFFAWMLCMSNPTFLDNSVHITEVEQHSFSIQPRQVTCCSSPRMLCGCTTLEDSWSRLLIVIMHSGQLQATWLIGLMFQVAAVNFSNQKQHEPYSKQNNCVIKECVRATYLGLPYVAMTKQVVIVMVMDWTKKLSFFPPKDGVSEVYSPKPSYINNYWTTKSIVWFLLGPMSKPMTIRNPQIPRNLKLLTVSI